MGNKGISQYSAVDASLGYLYQVRLALLWALRRLKTDPDFLVGVETLDDVTFETTGGDPTDLLQTKHHKTGTGSLSDASPDLWKTLRIWFEGHASGVIPKAANLYLVTTGTAPDGTAASRLRAFQRDVDAAQQALNVVAYSSSNQKLSDAFQTYRAASLTEQTAILNKVVVLDATPSITDIDSELRQEVHWAADRKHHSAFLERLEGWWFRRVLQQLTNVVAERIGSVELEDRMSDLREQFKQEALPIDDDLLNFTLDDATRIAHENFTFVRQLDLIKTSKKRIVAAIRDYFRAFEQRSRWLREELAIKLELDKYEKHLTEEWELVFEAMRDELGDDATEEAKEKAARAVLLLAEQKTIPIRPNVTAPFVSRGSFHMLSEEQRIGWHPEFRRRLALILSAKGEAV